MNKVGRIGRKNSYNSLTFNESNNSSKEERQNFRAKESYRRKAGV